MSGCTMSTARMPIIVFQAENSQSCSPPVTSIDSASVTCLVCSNSQYGQGSSKCEMPSASSMRPTSIALAGE